MCRRIDKSIGFETRVMNHIHEGDYVIKQRGYRPPRPTPIEVIIRSLETPSNSEMVGNTILHIAVSRLDNITGTGRK